MPEKTTSRTLPLRQGYSAMDVFINAVWLIVQCSYLVGRVESREGKGQREKAKG